MQALLYRVTVFIVVGIPTLTPDGMAAEVMKQTPGAAVPDRTLSASVPAGNSWCANHPANQWIRQSPREGAPAPGFYYEGSGAFDAVSGQWIHHGGHDGIPQGFHTFTCDLATGKWEQRFPPTSPPGVCCVDGANVLDTAHRCFVAFPGGSLGHGFQWSRGVRLKDSGVWAYDLKTHHWINMRPPPYREPEKYSRESLGGLCSGGTYDPNHELVLSFGGTGAGGAKNTLFAYDVYANVLYKLRSSNAPSVRDGMGLTYDTAHDKLVMFGSQYLSDERTWFYDLRTGVWKAHDLEPHPPARKTGTYSTIPRMAYDSLHKVVLCLVWLGEDKGHESWLLDPEKMQWTKLNPATEPAPSKSRSRNLSFSAAHNLFVLEISTINNRPELWTFRYQGATPAPRPTPPDHLTVVTDVNQAMLSWTASSSAGVRAYHIYRAEAERPWLAEFVKIGTNTETKFVDSSLASGRIWCYTVKAVTAGGVESDPCYRARTQPSLLKQPVVSVQATNRVEIHWQADPAADVIGYNLYRAVASVKTVRKGEPAAWKDNDPVYTEPKVVKITDLTGIVKLNDQPLVRTNFSDSVDLTRKGPEAADYQFAVYAYIVRAVNKLGLESGPSPYGLTIPSEPLNVLCREKGDTAELKWDANLEAGLKGYRVYQLKGTWEIIPVNDMPLLETTFSRRVGRGQTTRFWVTAVDALGQEGQPSSPAWCNHSYPGFFKGEWHQ